MIQFSVPPPNRDIYGNSFIFASVGEDKCLGIYHVDIDEDPEEKPYVECEFMLRGHSAAIIGDELLYNI